MFVWTVSSVSLCAARGRALALTLAALGCGACAGTSPVPEDSDSGAVATTGGSAADDGDPTEAASS
ncbi:MAG TPA: hypothetical protein VGB85_25045, partial [Nannocystis sp.]